VEDSLSQKLGIRTDNLNMTDSAYVTFDSIVDARIFVRTVFGAFFFISFRFFRFFLSFFLSFLMGQVLGFTLRQLCGLESVACEGKR
jgi:hypothetical protein